MGDMTTCGFCGHPGIHAQALPPRGTPSGSCPSCPQCQQELAEEAASATNEKNAQGTEQEPRQGSPESS